MHDYQKLAPILNVLQSDPQAIMRYDLFADALVWSDEVPEPEKCGDILVGSELRGIWHYRTSLILGQPKEKLRAAWEEALRCFPNWPGFSLKRQDAALASTFRAMQDEAMNKSDYFEDCVDAELARKGLNV